MIGKGGAEMLVIMKDWGPILSTRGLGEELRALIMDAARDNMVEVDFSGIDSLSHSFADECFGKMIETMGLKEFKARISLRNTNPFVRAVLLGAMGDRLASSRGLSPYVMAR